MFRFSILIFMIILNITAQSQNILKGKVTDEHTGEPIPGANVLITGTLNGTATDTNGEFELTGIENGIHKISFSHVAYHELVLEFNFPLDDNFIEGTEEFGLAIDNIEGDATLLAPRTALVTIVDNEVELEPVIDYQNFAELNSITLNGNAAQQNDVLRLTPLETRQKGSAFFNRPLAVDAETSFSTQFQFQLSGGTTGADGFTFMLYNNSLETNALGNRGGSLGYGNLTQSLAVEFDSNLNPFDTSDNHISILRDGDVRNPLATVDAPFDLNSGEVLNAWVDYDGDRNLLEVYLADSTIKPDAPLLAFNLDLDDVVGDRAFAGFSAATGGRANNHDLLSWQLTTNAELLTPSTSAVGSASAYPNSCASFNTSS